MTRERERERERERSGPLPTYRSPHYPAGHANKLAVLPDVLTAW